MDNKYPPKSWESSLESGSWIVKDGDGRKIATIEESSNSEAEARVIAASPYMLEALKAIMELIGDEDLQDNGELSGAAICDMGRSAIEIAS